MIFAHRGYSAKFPENTLLAFAEALKAGCDGIELDVHLSADGGLVIIHDEDVRRTTNGAGLVSEMRLGELRALDAGCGEKIPLLSEYFGLAAGFDVVTNIELKNDVVNYVGLEEKVLDLVCEFGLSDRVIISSFNRASVDKVKQLAPSIACGYLFSDLESPDWNTVFASMKSKGVEYVHPCVTSVNETFLAAASKHGIPFSVWTVNDIATMQRLTSHGAYAVFTDDVGTMTGGH